MKQSRGFTLTELLIVMGIIFILAFMSYIASSFYLPKIELSGQTRELVGDLRYAQQLAVTEQLNYAVCFFPLGGGGYEKKYQVIQHGQCGTSPALVERIFDNIEIEAVNFSNPEVVFNPYGSVAESGGIVLRNSEGATSTIDVRPSGFVKIID